MVLQGVTILETIIDKGLNSSVAWSVILSLTVFAVLLVIEMLNNLRSKKMLEAIGIGAVICSCIFVMIFAWADSQYTDTRYIVSVADNVSFNDFQQVYEIVERDGENYVVRVIGSLESINIDDDVVEDVGETIGTDVDIIE